ncbi:uncharacterized protein LOC113236882 [Hyposmocoma kahamanoa]|uniref:uncharacterized protein LOC113236882 n=1 Tax=Hyposmocoma kahamanoa TaxID=1477025 RepID=UPI000E6D8255|nr:uncharacterized protein LOC113236882 [Hyposmocoma kahamanoa]XP_026328878.1 uncharacterized protein LOC113236882 [Hyposmocoma kahamanoa]
MCRTVLSLFQALICMLQLAIRIIMTIGLMTESLIRLVLQSIYNFLSFLFQLISLLPICCVFLVTSKIKCALFSGGGGCPAGARGGSCDCILSVAAILILLLIFRATGVLDKIFHRLGYDKSFVVKHPTGTVSECSRNMNDTVYQLYDYDNSDVASDVMGDVLRLGETLDIEMAEQDLKTEEQPTTLWSSTTLCLSTTIMMIPTIEVTESVDGMISKVTTIAPPITPTQTIQILKNGLTQVEYLEYNSTTQQDHPIILSPKAKDSEDTHSNWTTVIYYLVA